MVKEIDRHGERVTGIVKERMTGIVKESDRHGERE